MIFSWERNVTGAWDKEDSNRMRTMMRAVVFSLLTFVPAGTVFGDTLLNRSASSSSTLYESGYDHGAWSSMDYDVTTAWMEGADGPGYGEYMMIYTEPYAVVTGGVIYPGFYKSEDLFYKNNAPTRLYIRTGSQESYLDVTECATSYQQNFAGYHFTFDEPLVSDGSIRVTIAGVRRGSLYDDTCVSELRFEGYVGDAASVPQFDQSIPHTSVASGEICYSDKPGNSGNDGNGVSYYIPDSVYDINGIGGDGREPGEPEESYAPTQDADYVDPVTAENLTQFASALYRIHCCGTSAQLDINDSNLYSFSRAYMLNWYQSHYTDDRITFGSGYNYAYEDDLTEILGELFRSVSPQEDLEALEVYFADYRKGQLFRLDPERSEWKSGPVYLELPSSVQEADGRILLTGRVMEYNEYAGYYMSTLEYDAYFVQDPVNSAIYRFDELITG